MVVLEQRGAKNMVKNKTYISFFLSPFSAATPLPPILCWVGMAIKKEAKILFFGTKGQIPISST